MLFGWHPDSLGGPTEGRVNLLDDRGESGLPLKRPGPLHVDGSGVVELQTLSQKKGLVQLENNTGEIRTNKLHDPHGGSLGIIAKLAGVVAGSDGPLDDVVVEEHLPA